MVAYATQAPDRQQWESSSQYSQSWNCGVTCAAFIAGYYRGTRFSIEQGRRNITGWGPYNVNGTLTYGCPPKTPTNAAQQRDMLIARGVPASARYVNTVDELHGLVDSGRRPIIVGIQMSRIPYQYRGHSFLGWHAVTFITGTYRDGKRGFLVNDPNFPAGSPSSRRFYPDWLVKSAWQDNVPRWCVVPNSLKPLTTTFTESQEMAILSKIESRSGRWFDVKQGTRLYKGPGTAYPVHLKATDSPERFWLHGFVGGEDGWVAATRSPTSRGVFFVPPAH
jgi:hypothetical protein